MRKYLYFVYSGVHNIFYLCMTIVSNIDSSVLYDTSEAVSFKDKGYNANMYNHTIYSHKIIIALGLENQLIANQIKYNYVYLIKSDGDNTASIVYSPDRKIGIYETDINDNEEPELDNIIIFPAVEKYIKNMGLRSLVDNKIKWFNAFILDNSFMSYESNTDLFELICDALNNAEISQNTIRDVLSKNVNEDIFDYYFEKHNDAKYHVDMQTAEVSKIKKKITAKKKKFDRQRPKGDGIKEQFEYTKLDDERKIAINMLVKLEYNLSKYKFMENLTTKEMFKTFIMTESFPANAWSITNVERLGGFKLILLNEPVFNEGDTTDVLQCFVDNINDIGTPFVPSQYMIVCEMNDGLYRLINFDELTKTFTFKNLPEVIKTKVADKCWDNDSGGLFHEIADFSKFTTLYKETHKTPEDSVEHVYSENTVDEDIANKLNPDFSNLTVFRFHKVANSNPLPGMGHGESIGPETVLEYSILSGIENWRRKLSDMYISQFELDGHKWNSVEHYYQANKFKQSAELFDKFISHDVAKSNIETDSTEAQLYGNSITRKRRTGATYVKYTELIDDDYTIEDGLLARENAQRAKFSQNYDLKQMLISTKNARLDEYKPYNTVAKVSISLAKIRREFVADKKI